MSIRFALLAVLVLAPACADGFGPVGGEGGHDDLGKADHVGLGGEPLVLKSSGSGFVPADFVRSESCALFADHVVVTKQFGLITLEEIKTVEVSGEVEQVIAAASEEPVEETDNSLCDGPGTFVSAGDTTLYSTGGCGSPKIERQGPATSALLEIVGQYCPKTF